MFQCLYIYVFSKTISNKTMKCMKKIHTERFIFRLFHKYRKKLLSLLPHQSEWIKVTIFRKVRLFISLDV